MRDLIQNSLLRLKAGERVVWCVILSAEGSTPRGAGAKMAVFENGLSIGTVGGGALELQAAAFARTLGEKAVIRSFALGSGGSEATGMICGGRAELGFLPFCPDAAPRMTELSEALDQPGGELRLRIEADGSFRLDLAAGEAPDSDTAPSSRTPRLQRMPDGAALYTEPIGPDHRVFIFGGGHVSAALTPVLLPLGFPVTVIDPRPELARAERFPGARVLLRDYDPFPAELRVSGRDYLIVMTPGHEKDLAVLRQALRTPASYIGCIGSRRKTAYVNQTLLEEGFSPADIARIHAPIGLPIQAKTPEEIAVSIAAQLILHRAGGAR